MIADSLDVIRVEGEAHYFDVRSNGNRLEDASGHTRIRTTSTPKLKDRVAFWDDKLSEIEISPRL